MQRKGGVDINSLLPRGKLFEDVFLPLCVYFRNKTVFFGRRGGTSSGYAAWLVYR